MARFTILGGAGFIGAHLARRLRACGDEVARPGREAALDGDLGHVVYAIGLTADFRGRPYATIEAHVSRLSRLLERARFESLLYLSSTRVYAHAANANEDAVLPVDPRDPDDLYNLSKLAGESLCLGYDLETARVARLSNVFGPPADGAGMHPASLIAGLVRSAALDGRVRLRSAPDSAKDYVDVDDVARALRQIALHGRRRLYNVAAGTNVSNRELAEQLARMTGCSVEYAEGAPTVVFPRIRTERLEAEFAPPERPWAPASVLARIGGLLEAHRRAPALAGEWR
jgi:nucleoside-diphosphate-sugar epimerase